MTLRGLLTINVPISILFGVGCVFFPEPLMEFYGVELTAAGIATTRLAGAAFFGWAALAFLARNGSREFMRGSAVALLVQDAIAAVASVVDPIGGDFNWFGWTTPLVYGLLATGYGWYLFVRPPEPASMRAVHGRP